MLFTKLTLCSQIRNIVLTVAMNLVFIYLGEECLVITYSASELVLWTPDVILFTVLGLWASCWAWFLKLVR